MADETSAFKAEKDYGGRRLGRGRRPRGEEMPNLDRFREKRCLCF